jgi:hypothetical protein
MHTIEEIIADAQSAVAASLRQAYDAGRHHQTTEMREKFVAFFDGVFAPLSGAPAAEAAAEAVPETPPAEATAEAAAVDAPAEAPVAAETPAEIPPEATAEPASAA